MRTPHRIMVVALLVIAAEDALLGHWASALALAACAFATYALSPRR